jgi:hypothetical protein
LRTAFSSLPPEVERPGQKIQAHRGGENRLYRMLDTTFNKDPCRIRSGHTAENIAIIRRFAVNLPKQDTTTQPGIKNKRLRMTYDANYRNRILFGTNKERGAI